MGSREFWDYGKRRKSEEDRGQRDAAGHEYGTPSRYEEAVGMAHNGGPP